MKFVCGILSMMVEMGEVMARGALGSKRGDLASLSPSSLPNVLLCPLIQPIC